MIIKLLFFGITSDLIGEHSLNFDVEENLDVFALKKILIAKYPVLKNIHEFAIAVNENYAEDELILKNGDIVAIIPPVSGG